MPKQNMNGFATILRVVICFIILMDLTEISVEFCVVKFSSFWVNSFDGSWNKEWQEPKLGDAHGTPKIIQGHQKVKAWGCPGRHPLFLQQVSVCFRIRFIHAICANLGASFAFSFHFSFMHHAGMR